VVGVLFARDANFDYVDVVAFPSQSLRWAASPSCRFARLENKWSARKALPLLSGLCSVWLDMSSSVQCRISTSVVVALVLIDGVVHARAGPRACRQICRRRRIYRLHTVW
jgi:hypothetical protein